MIKNKKYHNYLLKRSFKSLIYRNYFLYPKLSKYMKKKTLDLGCGIGDLLKYNNEIVGIDINLENVKYCKSHNLNAHIMEINVIPFKSNSFSSIILDNVLEHIEDPNNILLEIKRVLINNGTLIIGVPGQKGYESDNDHKKFYNLSILKKTFKKNAILIDYFYAPINNNFFDKILKQHCLYAIFKLIKN